MGYEDGGLNSKKASDYYIDCRYVDRFFREIAEWFPEWLSRMCCVLLGRWQGPVAQRLEQPRMLSGLVTRDALCLIRNSTRACSSAVRAGDS